MSRFFSFIFSGLFFTAANLFAQNSIHLPLGGNAWIHGGKTARITEKGITNWADPAEVVDVYVRFAKAGKVKIFLKASVDGKSKLSVTISGKSKTISLAGTSDQFDTGEWDVAGAGYVKISLKGISKTAATFAALSELIFEGSAVDEQTFFVKDSKDNYFYWGRRGPSVHLNYTLPANEDIEWFYNEVTVPEKQDVIGSYFMADGFGEGYFGMQVNSETERRILFSVWSPFKTDDPKSIPLDKQIVMLRKGADVHTGEFGNEGSGGQSYLKYNWKAGNTYRFLLNGKPAGDSTTTYTAYFFAPEENQWRIIASFKRPKTHTYLKRFHSFLENFIPQMGDLERKVNFGNQWVRSSSGKWTELTQAKFTADATARKGYRMDYAGGKDKDLFFLQNCGFFKDYTEINTMFERQSSGKEPVIDFKLIDQLPAGTSKQP
ncbi:DUF3472 domain-containing protein [Dyadobacter psychrotolerans]|uniref:DUF3472 domain-containing protein n=1 Tax=Dyadobacter psychrotolerans TaxID=2541721 RepID=A0A4R5DNF9_9BACT|nr:DUF3472 domain-containing protein [Dyadobacter psychrotolerans]TDE13674.1 DUF3472 domain-containing protein [Dyadobacter psychrotolerans]